MAIYQVSIKVITPLGYKNKTITGVVFGKKKKTLEKIKAETLAFVQKTIIEDNQGLQLSFEITKMVRLKEGFMFKYDE